MLIKILWCICCIRFSSAFAECGLSTRALKPDSLNLYLRSRFNVVSRELHTVRRLRALHSWTGFHATFRSIVIQQSTHFESGSRPCGGIVVFGYGSKIHIGSVFKGPVWSALTSTVMIGGACRRWYGVSLTIE